MAYYIKKRFDENNRTRIKFKALYLQLISPDRLRSAKINWSAAL